MTVRAASQSSGPVILGKSAVAVSCPVDTTEDVLATINIPILSANSSLRITTNWTTTNSANSKICRVRFSTITGTVFQNTTVTTVATFRAQCEIANRGATNSQVGAAAGNAGFAQAAGAIVTAAVDTSAATTLIITGQKALNSETLTLESYLVELLP